MIRALAIAGCLATALAGVYAAQDHPRDVITSTDVELATAPRPRPEAWLEAMKRAALAGRPGSGWEFDHRIPRCLGGADDLSNLWLQPCSAWRMQADGIRVCIAGPAYVKDLEEKKRCREVRRARSVPLLVQDQQYFREWKDP